MLDIIIGTCMLMGCFYKFANDMLNDWGNHNEPGIENQCFIASAKAVSCFQDIGDRIWGVVELDKIHIFNNPIYIHPLIPNLEFLKDKEYWWRYLQGGITSITSNDFKLITSKPRK